MEINIDGELRVRSVYITMINHITVRCHYDYL